MSHPSVYSPDQANSASASLALKFRQFALRQRLSAERATLPRIREQLLLSAEKLEFLANHPEFS